MNRFFVLMLVLSIIVLGPVCYAQQRPSNIGLQSVEFNATTDIAVVYSTLYYQTSDRMLVPVNFPIPKQEGMGKAAVSLLVDSAALREKLRYYDLYPVLPEDTVVLGMTIKDGVAKVDFSKDLLQYGSKKEEENVFNSIAFSLTEFITIDKVEIFVEGQKLEQFKFGFSPNSLFVK